MVPVPRSRERLQLPPRIEIRLQKRFDWLDEYGPGGVVVGPVVVGPVGRVHGLEVATGELGDLNAEPST